MLRFMCTVGLFGTVPEVDQIYVFDALLLPNALSWLPCLNCGMLVV